MAEKRVVYLLNVLPERGKNLNATHALGLHNLRVHALGDPAVRISHDIIVDLSTTDEKAWDMAKRVVNAGPEILGFTCFIWNLKPILEVCRLVRKALPSIRLVIGGPGAAVAETIPEISSLVDTIITGEGEIAFHRLLTSGGFTACIRGQKLETDASTPSFYTPENCTGLSGEVILITGRGCDYNCSFCSSALAGKSYIHPDRIEKDLECLMKGVVSGKGTYIYLIEQCIDSDLPRFKDFLRMAARLNSNSIPFSVHTSLHTLDDELIGLMDMAECRFLRVDFLSTNVRALKSIGAPVPPLDRIENIALHRDRFSISLDVIVGLPDDDYEGVKKTLSYAAGIGILDVNTTRLCVIPGTPFSRRVHKKNMDYDGEYPYLLRSAPGFSGQDMDRAEKLVNSFKTVAEFITPALNEYLAAECGFDIVQFSEDIQERFPSWEQSFTQMAAGESEIRVSPCAADYVEKFMLEVIRNPSCARVASEFMVVSREKFMRHLGLISGKSRRGHTSHQSDRE